MKYYSFTWHKNEKYREPTERTHLIMTGEGISPKEDAIAIFHKNFGSAKAVTITGIQELAVVQGYVDETASAYNQYLEPIGEVFLPE